MVCEICASDIPEEGIKALDDLTCPKCGQVYGYDEGYGIVLTQEQCDLLKKAKDL